MAGAETRLMHHLLAIDRAPPDWAHGAVGREPCTQHDGHTAELPEDQGARTARALGTRLTGEHKAVLFGTIVAPDEPTLAEPPALVEADGRLIGGIDREKGIHRQAVEVAQQRPE